MQTLCDPRRDVRWALGALAVGCGVAQASTPLIGIAFRDPNFGPATRLFDVDASTGLASNARLTGADAISGIALRRDGTLFGWADEFANVNGSAVDGALVTIDRATGATTLIGDVSPFNSGALSAEGDIDFDPITGDLFGVTSNNGVSLLFTIDTTTGANSEIGIVQQPGSDISGMAFDDGGDLWLLDTSFEFGDDRVSRLLRVDRTSGDVFETVTLSVALGTVGGMDFDPATGQLFIADGDLFGTNNLYTADLFTGEMTLVGSTGLDGAPFGFGGLSDIEFIPAPGGVAALAMGLGLLARRRREG
ncbi:MAG: hypothetical protein AAF356_04735 [Planctomycetota bacterium]